MQPVRVKVYGLISLTKRTYLTIQIIGLVLVPTLLLVSLWLPRPQLPPGRELSPQTQFFVWLLDIVPWLCLLILIVEPIETLIVLRRFSQKQKEAEETARLAETQPPP
jgi:hypothetical protein